MTEDEFKKHVTDKLKETNHQITFNMVEKKSIKSGLTGIYKIAYKSTMNWTNNSIIESIVDLASRSTKLKHTGGMNAYGYTSSSGVNFSTKEEMIDAFDNIIEYMTMYVNDKFTFHLKLTYTDDDKLEKLKELDNKTKGTKINYIVQDTLFPGNFNAKVNIKVRKYGNKTKDIMKELHLALNMLGDIDVDFRLPSTIVTEYKNRDKKGYGEGTFYNNSFSIYMDKEDVNYMAVATGTLLEVNRIEIINET